MEALTLQQTVKVALRDGLHARPASRLVQMARQHRATIELEREGLVANAKSSVKLILLGLKQDDEVLLRVSGEAAQAALEQVRAFLATPEDDDEAVPAAPQPDLASSTAAAADDEALAPGAVRGLAASAGCALGPVFAYFAPPLPAAAELAPAGSAEAEAARARAALDAVAARLRARAEADTRRGPILAAMADIAADEDWAADIRGRLQQGASALAAVQASGAALAARLAAMADAYLRARAEDVRAVARAAALELLGQRDPSWAELPDGAVVVADELSALDLADAPMSRLAAIVCRQGGVTSHSAIVARAHGVPAVFGVDLPVPALREARTIAVDGGAGAVWLDPGEAACASIRARIESERATRSALERWRGVSPRTRDGREIHVAANLGSPEEIEAARAAGAMGVGLFRTELMFMQSALPPGEDEQAAVYRRVAEAFAPHPVVIRTLDVGGDKPVPGVEAVREDNPFLGWRGVRLCLDRPEVFKPQLRALLRAAVAGNLRVMVPMVSDLGEIHAVKRLIDTCRDELRAEGVPHGEFQLGIMIETPAAVLQAGVLAAEVAFFSIGTNDLTQYVMAADRVNPRVAALYRCDHPAVLHAIALTCQAAARAGIPVGVCGEAAADPALMPRLIECGVTELSMSPSSILRAKAAICEL